MKNVLYKNVLRNGNTFICLVIHCTYHCEIVLFIILCNLNKMFSKHIVCLYWNKNIESITTSYFDCNILDKNIKNELTYFSIFSWGSSVRHAITNYSHLKLSTNRQQSLWYFWIFYKTNSYKIIRKVHFVYVYYKAETMVATTGASKFALSQKWLTSKNGKWKIYNIE